MDLACNVRPLPFVFLPSWCWAGGLETSVSVDAKISPGIAVGNAREIQDHMEMEPKGHSMLHGCTVGVLRSATAGQLQDTSTRNNEHFTKVLGSAWKRVKVGKPLFFFRWRASWELTENSTRKVGRLKIGRGPGWKET
jgi:hypothetical protein